jgi:hypothetical protein
MIFFALSSFQARNDLAQEKRRMFWTALRTFSRVFRLTAAAFRQRKRAERVEHFCQWLMH